MWQPRPPERGMHTRSPGSRNLPDPRGRFLRPPPPLAALPPDRARPPRSRARGTPALHLGEPGFVSWLFQEAPTLNACPPTSRLLRDNELMWEKSPTRAIMPTAVYPHC